MAAAKVAAAVELPHVGVAEPPGPVSGFPSTIPELPKVEQARANIAELKKRYLEERDKRLNSRPEGNAQYKEFKGIFEKYLKDPYVERVEREPIEEEIDFLVLGGGYGGQCVAAELIRAGITNIRLIEKAGDFGGTCKFTCFDRILGA
jgi:cyclohexanone monooxygenase